jgi:uncharacterized protein YhaN
VRLRRLRAVVFGPHRDRDLDLDADVVLVFGRNESGKSCFRTAVETVLYGFDPAKRETHPLFLWNEGPGDDLHVEADLVLDDGSVLPVERVLQAVGKSRTTKDGESFTGPRQGNAPLPFVEGLPRKLFQTIYSIEIEQLAALAAGVQEHVDDLLLPEARSLRLRPTSEIAEARVQAGEARREEDGLRSALAEKSELEERLRAYRKAKADLERVARDAPYRRDLCDLVRRERQLGDPVDLSGLGDLPLVEPATVERKIEKIEEDLAEPRERLDQEAPAIGEPQQALLDASAEIQVILDAAPKHAADFSRCEEARERGKKLRGDAEGRLAGVRKNDAEAVELDAVAALPLERLRSAQASWARAFEEHLAAPAREPGRAPLWTLVVAAVGVVGASAAAFSGLSPWLVLLGVVAVATAACFAFFARSAPRRTGLAPPSRPGTVAEILEGLPIAADFLASPTELLRLIEVLGDAQKMVGDAADSEKQARQLSQDANERVRAWGVVCARHGLDAKGEGSFLVERLREALEAAREAEKRVGRDEGERRQAESAIRAGMPALERERAHLEALRSTLRRAEPDAPDFDEAYRRVRERMQEQHVVREQKRRLSADPRWSKHRDDPSVTGESVPEDADWLEEATAKRDATLEAVNDDIETANERLGALSTRLEQDAGSRSARARDAVVSLEEELAAVKRDRDRLALLDSILARAEHVFREEHQPDVLRRASDHLARVTGGRYSGLYYLEGEDGGLHVACADHSEPVRVRPPISRGTLDQIFLCLRLGLLEHLDRDHERLPLILDDALLRMDDARRPEVYGLLADIAPTRQVFVLTCHAAIADEVEKELSAARIDLSHD